MLRRIHIHNIHVCNTNKQECLNGEFASRFRQTRGINKMIFHMAVLYNYIKSHGSMNDKTPAEAVGIYIEGTNTYKTPHLLSDAPISIYIIVKHADCIFNILFWVD